ANLLMGSPTPRRIPSGSSAGPPRGAGAPAPSTAPFPPRLAFIVGRTDRDPAAQLYLADGRGQNAFAPGPGHRASWFVWSPDGSRIAVVDGTGTLHEIPGGATVRG